MSAVKSFYSFSEIRAVGDCAAFARDVFGVTIRNGRCAAVWRGGTNPESVSISREEWFDHGGPKKGGGILELAAHRFGGDIQQTQAFLGGHYHLTPRMTTRAAPSSHESRYDRLIADGYQETSRYHYRDAGGTTRHVTVRLQHPDKPGKEFVQGHADGDGRFIWSLKDVDTILYRLPEISASSWVVICEGEKSADRLASIGMPRCRLLLPSMETPFTPTVSLSFVCGVLPPVAEARSMITEPLRMVAIISAVTSIGAFLPGICAVVMTISAFFTASAIRSCCLRWYSSLCSTA
jgi:hypothetical protein